MTVTNPVVSSPFDLNVRYGTDEKGRYMAYYYIPPCPGFTFNYTIPIYVSIPYRTYNPQRKRGYGEYLFWGISDYTCIGPPLYPPSLTLGGVMSHINLISELAARDDTPSEANFPIDVTLISGRFSLHNPVGGNNGSAGTQVPVGERTIRQPLPEPDPEQSDYQTPVPKDYNGDDQDDHVSDLDALTDDYIKDIGLLKKTVGHFRLRKVSHGVI